jgi:hypothetical protein
MHDNAWRDAISDNNVRFRVRAVIEASLQATLLLTSPLSSPNGLDERAQREAGTTLEPYKDQVPQANGSFIPSIVSRSEESLPKGGHWQQTTEALPWDGVPTEGKNPPPLRS